VAVEARVVRVHVEESLLTPGDRRHIDADRWDPLIMKFCEFYGNSRNVHPSRLASAWAIPGPTSANTGA
jgi:flavin reductase (DIM6/NTAB) family NADH-FMN oxidoreductase RutF